MDRSNDQNSNFETNQNLELETDIGDGQKKDISEDTTFKETYVTEKLIISQGDYAIIKVDNKNLRYGLPSKLTLDKKAKVKFDVTEVVGKVLDNLSRQPFSLLHCSHVGIKDSIFKTIARQKTFSNHTILFGSFDVYVGQEFSHLLYDCQEKYQKDEGEKLLLLLTDTKKNKIPMLLEKLMELNPEGKKSIFNQLKTDFKIIYVTSYKGLSELKDFTFDFNEIDTLQIYKDKHNITTKEWKIICDKQQEEKLSKDVEGLLKDLDKIIEEPNRKTLIEAIGNENSDFRAILKSKDQPLAKYVLFISILFPELSPDVFWEYVSLLVRHRKKEIINGSKTSLFKLWLEEPDTILDYCGLEKYHINNQYIIDFASLVQAKDCENTLFKKYTLFADQNARLLIDNQQLFSKNTSVKIHERLHVTIAKLANYFKDYYGNVLLRKWLFELEKQRSRLFALYHNIKQYESKRAYIQSLINKGENIKYEEDALQILAKTRSYRRGYNFEKETENLELIKFLFSKEASFPENASINDVLTQLYEYRESNNQKLFQTRREYTEYLEKLDKNVYLFVELLSTIFREDDTQKLVTDFFANAVQTIFRNYILFEVLTWFQIKNTDFNSLEFFEILLEHEDEEVCENGVKALSSLLVNHPHNFYKYLEQSRIWFSTTSSSEQSETKLAKNTSRAFFHALNDQRKYAKTQGNKKVNINSLTYIALFEQTEKMKEHLCFIFSRLFDIQIIFPDYEEKVVKKEFWQLVAKIVEHWYSTLIAKSNASKENTDSTEKLDSLMMTILKCLSKEKYKNLLLGFNDNRNSYNEQITEQDDIKKCTKIRKRRDTLVQLITHLKDAHV